MGWSELERLVDQAEADGNLRRALGHCRSQEELVLAARQLGFRITRMDLRRARELHDRDDVGGVSPAPSSANH
jgi:hypothetical protein